MCSATCTTDADCEGLASQTSCDRSLHLCTTPCTADAIGDFQCVEGVRHWCEDDPTISCSICPAVCGTGAFCDGAACQPRRAGGAACTSDEQCESFACTSAGRCSVEQGEACAPESCDGACASRPDGHTYCLRSRCPLDCADRTDGGLTWTCARYASGFEVCAPLERCTWEGSCSTFTSATCGQSCASSGCWTYCIPNEISPDAP